ncbi:MAG: DNA polymerase III subunit gamma/tau [Bacteroidaceae bacterium]|nr:DNA polymerase III subunit gamma/tau [Bacteroidaceae bacterium]
MENYIVSARKYRPDTFESVVAQKALTTTLKNAILSGKLAHAYLFCGPRGVGKTTCARIFAKTINCEHPTADGEPCNNCESCVSFNQQRSYSIYELDAASNNSVDEIRSLNEQVRIPPQLGRYKVYIIDEVHMLSQAAFNAFLKTLEEPPAHAIFILATTEKHKIIPTILSRCQIYDFSRIESVDIISHLQGIAKNEGINAEHEALRIVAQKSDGCMRDALSLFDQMVSFTQGDLTYAKVIESLNVLDYDFYFRFTDYMLSGKTSHALLLFNDILSKGFEGNIFIEGLASHFRDLLVASDEVTIPLFEGDQELCARYTAQARSIASKKLFKAIKLCNDCSMNYRLSRNKRLLVELTIIQLTQLSSDDSEEAGGHGPKQLKPIFNKQQEVPVAPAAQANVSNIKSSQAVVEQPKMVVDSPIVTSQPKEKPKVVSGRPESLRVQPQGKTTLGMFRSTMSAQKSDTAPIINKVNIEVAVSDTEQKRKYISDEELSRAWMSFALSLPENERALADRMKIMHPVMHDENSFDISVDNQLVADMFDKESKRIIEGLADGLGGVRLRMGVTVNKVVVQRRVYDRTKQFEMLKEKNPVIGKLREALGLELS